jgi:hypothetical protein
MVVLSVLLFWLPTLGLVAGLLGGRPEASDLYWALQ